MQVTQYPGLNRLLFCGDLIHRPWFSFQGLCLIIDCVKSVSGGGGGGGGGYSNYFLMGCAARGLKPLPTSKDFSPSKNG